jgi:predicted RNase H-like nuclease
MARLLGVDGCKAGWIAIRKDTESGAIDSEILTSGYQLIDHFTSHQVVALDIPIGLTDSGPRQCDILARRLLGKPRSNSVFPAPIRSAVAASARNEADAISRSIQGKGVGAQAFGIYPRIREIDEIMRGNELARKCIHEVHPEVCFMAWNDGTPIICSKKFPEGLSIRLRLVKDHFGEEAVRIVRQGYLRGQVADDDIYDAFAALWTAERIQLGKSVVIPDPPEVDSCGLPMRILY